MRTDASLWMSWLSLNYWVIWIAKSLETSTALPRAAVHWGCLRVYTAKGRQRGCVHCSAWNMRVSAPSSQTESVPEFVSEPLLEA